MSQWYKIICICLLLTLCAGRVVAQEQDIRLRGFSHVPTDLTGSMRAIVDNAGEPCATILFNVRDTAFIVEGNLGVLKRETGIGEIRVWVPVGTKRLTIKHEGMFPLRGYELPIRLKPKSSYHVYLWATIGVDEPKPLESVDDEPILSPNVVEEQKMPIDDVYEQISSIVDEKATPHLVEESVTMSTGRELQSERNSETNVYLSAGCDVLSLIGPSFFLRFNANHFITELGGTYGLKKSDKLYFYSSEKLLAGYQYHEMKGQIRLGYEIKIAKWFAITPLVGGVLNVLMGESIKTLGNTDDYRKASSLAGSMTVQFALWISDIFGLYASPEYNNLPVYKSNNYKLIADGNEIIKKWGEGFGVNVGIMIRF